MRLPPLLLDNTNFCLQRRCCNTQVSCISKGKDWVENEGEKYQTDPKTAPFTKDFCRVQCYHNRYNNINDRYEHEE